MANPTINKKDVFTMRLNPWDERAFGFKVTEILSLAYTDAKVIESIDQKNRELQSRLCCFRHDSSDFKVRQDLLLSGFYVAEHSFEMSGQLSRLKQQKHFQFIKAQTQHIAALQEIVARDFRFSRFHEDPFIDSFKAAKRNEYWIKDLVNEGKCWLTENEEKGVVGFFVFEKKGDDVRLILAGINSQYKGFGLFFWLSIIDFLKDKGQNISSLISAANIEVVNIYAHLGFTIVKSMFDYHKRY